MADTLDRHIRGLVGPARTIYEESIKVWGEDRATVLIGRDPAWVATLEKVSRLAVATSPILIVGETGTGKELIARGLFLLSTQYRRAFVSVNCAQYTNEQIMASELFGHRKGSFTGAHSDHAGLFEANEGGLIFLDEIAELSLAAQAMLLRAISEREILPVGATRAKPVNVRIVAATNRDLRALVEQGTFRADLFYRLHQLCVRTPPLRQRGRDWELIAQYHLDRLAKTYHKRKSLAADAVEWLRGYSWPGNVRELTGCIETGFHMSVGDEITLRDIGEALEATVQDDQLRRTASASMPYSSAEYCERISGGEGTFWELIYEPFMARDLNRVQVREVIAHGLALADGSYKRMLRLFGMPDSDYLRFMDFLRHHRLKPPRERVMAARLMDGGSPEAGRRAARAARRGENGQYTQPDREAR